MNAQAKVIPFQFDAQEIRSLLIDEKPWFVAGDVAAALQYRDSHNMCRNLDDDEKGTQIVSTPYGDQEMNIINESGLYSAILRSRKAEAKRFKKWVTNEVLPAIRRTGRYDLADTTIGTDGMQILQELIGKKVKMMPNDVQHSAKRKLWSVLHTRFNVPRGEMIAANDFDAACNFVAAYAIHGEYLPRQERLPMMPPPAPVPVPLSRGARENLEGVERTAHRVSAHLSGRVGQALELLNEEVYHDMRKAALTAALLARHLGKELLGRNVTDWPPAPITRTGLTV